MKPIYEIHLPVHTPMEYVEKISEYAEKRLGEDYHIVVLVDQNTFTTTRIIYPTATFWGWWYNLWNA